MTRTTIATLLTAYFLATLAFGALVEMQNPFPRLDAPTTGAAVGRALSVYVSSGIIPVIVWAFGRFRAQKAAGPLVSWALLAVVVALLEYVGHRYDLDQRVSELTSGAPLSGKNRDDFVRSARQGCISSQQQGQLNRQVGVTNQQINSYCDCYADGIAKSITADELRYAAMNSKASASLQEKIDRLSPRCSQAAFGR